MVDSRKMKNQLLELMEEKRQQDEKYMGYNTSSVNDSLNIDIKSNAELNTQEIIQENSEEDKEVSTYKIITQKENFKEIDNENYEYDKNDDLDKGSYTKTNEHNIEPENTEFNINKIVNKVNEENINKVAILNVPSNLIEGIRIMYPSVKSNTDAVTVALYDLLGQTFKVSDKIKEISKNTNFHVQIIDESFNKMDKKLNMILRMLEQNEIAIANLCLNNLFLKLLEDESKDIDLNNIENTDLSRGNTKDIDEFLTSLKKATLKYKQRNNNGGRSY